MSAAKPTPATPPVVTCPRCGKSHAMTPDAILAGCTAVSAVDFNAKGQVTRIEFFPPAPVIPPTPAVTRTRRTERVVEEVRADGDKRVVVKVRTV